MSDKRYFDLRIPAPRRLALMRRHFAEHASKYPYCPESAKPRTWRDVRRYGMHNWQSAFCMPDFGGTGRDRVIYSHCGAASMPVRNIKDAADIVRLNHTGWYSDSDGDETIKGIVAYVGRGKWIAGIERSDNAEITLYLSSIFDDARDAAFCADSIAENLAEDEREYHEKWCEASRLDDDIESKLAELCGIRQAYRIQVAIVRALRKSSGADAGRLIDAAKIGMVKIRDTVADLITDIRDLREQRENLEIKT